MKVGMSISATLTVAVLLAGCLVSAQLRPQPANPNTPNDGLLPTRGLPRTRFAAMVLNQRDRIQCHMRNDSYFPCEMAHTAGRRSRTVPTSVHRLRPGDIQVIGAMGDSLTAAAGAQARSILQVATEYRGVSWSGGGLGDWKEYLTLPNVLKNFNPNLYGYSTHKTLVGISSADGFNVAVSGSESDELPEQAHRLIERMRKDPNVNFEKDWKLVTIFTGNNDICSHSCKGIAQVLVTKDATPRGYTRHIRKALDILHTGLPRTFVNLVPPADVSMLFDIHDKPFPCHHYHQVECPCLVDDKLTRPHKTQKEVRQILTGYLRGLEKLIRSGRYDRRPDFTVVLQPTTIRASVPWIVPYPGARAQPDLSYLAPDCFHFAQKTLAMIARGLWNNMLEPVGHKTPDYMRDGVPFLCPTEENPYLATAKNSRTRMGRMKSFARDFLDTMQRTGPQACPL